MKSALGHLGIQEVWTEWFWGLCGTAESYVPGETNVQARKWE